MNATNKMRQGFTLIELLVVVAIIAVIGAGVAVTYRNLDDKAKTAMEMSDCGILQKVIKHWSALNNYKIPNKLDSLVDLSDHLYSQMVPQTGFTGIDDGVNGSYGLYGQIGYTASVETAPDIVIENLAASGLTQVFKHDTTRSPANDSTFAVGMLQSSVDTSKTLYTLATGSSDARAAAQAIVDADADKPSTDPATGNFQADDGSGNMVDTPYVVNGTSYTTLAEFNAALATAQATLDAQEIDKLAFIAPTLGAQMMGMVAPMNLVNEIISNIGLTPAEVARPSEDQAAAQEAGRKYYLVVMGLGRFATIYSGKAVRADMPATGKRYPQTEANYSRYLVVIKVPVATYESMYGSSQPCSIACVLTPQGLSSAALRDTYQTDEEKVRDNN